MITRFHANERPDPLRLCLRGLHLPIRSFHAAFHALRVQKKCAYRVSASLSKNRNGFTGTRCGYCVVPCELVVHSRFQRSGDVPARYVEPQTVHPNSTAPPYIIQKGAELQSFTEGRQGTVTDENNSGAYYQEKCPPGHHTADTLKRRRNIRFFGGVHSP